MTENKAELLLPLNMQTLKAFQLQRDSPPDQGLSLAGPRWALHSRLPYRLMLTFSYPRPMRDDTSDCSADSGVGSEEPCMPVRRVACH